MRKYLLLLSLTILTTLTYGQDLRWGLRVSGIKPLFVGINKDMSTLIHFNPALLMEVGFDRDAIISEIGIKNYLVDPGVNDKNLLFRYISIPVAYKRSVSNNIYLYGGASGDILYKTVDGYSKEIFSKPYFSALVGSRIYFDSSVFIDFRANFGISNRLKEVDNDRINSYSVGVGFTL